MQKILITGHRGFIGSNLLNRLEADSEIPSRVDLVEGSDIRNFDFNLDYDVIYHLAANASIPESMKDPTVSHDHNVNGTLRVLELARKTGARIVFSSSSSIYGDAEELPTKETAQPKPVSPYALQKLICEQYMQLYWELFGVKSVALRYMNVFGEGQERANGGYCLALSKFIDQYKKGEPFTIVGDGEQRRDFIYVKDVVEANIKAAEWLKTADKFEIINIGSGRNYSINEVVNMISPVHPRITLEPRIEPRANMADITKAEELLNWQPTKTLPQWLKENL